MSVLNPSIFSIPQAQGSWFDVVYDYSHDYIMHSFEDSLQRLGLARIDILYVHDIGAYQHGAAAPQHVQTLRESGYRALESVKRSGTVGAIGIGVNEREVLLEAMEWAIWMGSCWPAEWSAASARVKPATAALAQKT